MSNRDLELYMEAGAPGFGVFSKGNGVRKGGQSCGRRRDSVPTWCY